MKKLLLVACLFAAPGLALAQETKKPEPYKAERESKENPLILFKTSMGDIKIELFAKEAPKTVKNFIELAEGKKEWKDPKTGKMVKRPFYDGLIFHRVIKNFMLQGGCPLKNGMGGPGYSFEDEINAKALGLDKKKAMVDGKPHGLLGIRSQQDMHRGIVQPVMRKLGIQNQEDWQKRIAEVKKEMDALTFKDVFESLGYKYNDELESHQLKRGILAMANAGPATNGSQFFINLVDTPHLNGKHTAFGHVIEGFDVVEKIGEVKVNAQAQPDQKVTIISIRVVKEEKKK